MASTSPSQILVETPMPVFTPNKHEQEKVVADKNKAQGIKFFKDNAEKTNVRTTPSGLQYMVIAEGTGDRVKYSDVVEVNFRGATIDGKELDSSAKHGSSAILPVNRMIKGFSEALQMMSVGSEWVIYVPPDLAYGDEGAGDDIPPGATLVFDIKVLSIKHSAS